MESLTQYCQRRDIPKGSAHRYLSGLGFDLSGGLSPEAIAALEARYPSTPVEVEATQAPSPTPAPGAYAPVLGGLALRTAAPLAAYSAPSTQAEVEGITQSVQSLLATSTARTAAAMGELHRGAGATGRQLGALLGAEIVNQAEATKAQVLAEYLQSQGIPLGEPPAPQAGA